MEISVRKRRGKKFAICNFYSISQTCYVSGKNAVLALTRKFPDFLPRGGNLLRFWWEHPLSKEIFPAVKIGRAFFSVSSPDFAPKTAFRQNKVGRGGRGSKPPSLIFRHFTTAKRGQQPLIHISTSICMPTLSWFTPSGIPSWQTKDGAAGHLGRFSTVPSAAKRR